MYCRRCGADVGNSNYCPNCGARQDGQGTQNVHPANAYAPPQYPMDTGNWGWFILSFLIPPLGFILWLAWMGVKPRCSGKCGWGFAAGLLFWFFIAPMLFVMWVLALPESGTVETFVPAWF